MTTRRRLPPLPMWPLFLILLAALLALACWLYLPGLGGGFQFDDFANLPALGATGPIDDWATFWRYITSGHADPTGRPLALLSFLIDARNWPAAPWPFLRTNLLLHLLNGALLALLLRRLGQSLAAQLAQPTTTGSYNEGVGGPNRTLRINLAALLGAAFWLLHPLLVSTTLYIVQREAMLPATFTLLGLLLWLHGRRLLQRGRLVGGVVWIVLGFGGCTLLAVLSKGNGILLPALALVIDQVLLARSGRTTTGEVANLDDAMPPAARSAWRGLMIVLAWLPAAFVAAYLAHAGWHGMVHGIAALRPWTLGQRLMTEPRVLLDYLSLLWVPRPFTPGLFNDQIHASASLLVPWSTLPCLLVVLGLIVGAWLLRRRWPALAVAVLFYFVGHSLESSTLALELYFEHRNYLPALLMFWPLALWLCGVRQVRGLRTGEENLGTGGHRPGTGTEGAEGLDRSEMERVQPGKSAPVSPATVRWGKLVLALLLVAGLGAMAHARASLWGSVHDQALLWARLNPQSPRAQANAAQVEMQTGRPRRAVARLQPLLAQDPSEVQLALNLFGAECQLGAVTDATLQASIKALNTTRNPGALLVHWFDRLIAEGDHPPCPQAGYATIHRLLEAVRRNRRLMKIAGRRQDVEYLLGRLALAQRQPDAALAYFNRALDQQVRVSAALKQAALLGAAGYPQRGLAHLNHYAVEAQEQPAPGMGMPRLHAWVLHHQHYWTNELARLRETLSEDAATHTAQPPVGQSPGVAR
ncbi:MAG TPA: tetratricopeptide repeat protein [Rhodanobacteraceae bacterium]|nr:tetratricopeptide repeat protein [Rhodanobacteraceae bacterium]